MAKVFKSGDATRILDAAMEEFPLREMVRPDFPSMGPNAEELNPQAIRNAIMAEARAEAEQRIQEAYQEAYERGMAAGLASFEESIANVAESLDAASEAMLHARQEYLDALEPQVVELVRLIAQAVVQREIRGDSELIHRSVRRALAVLADRQYLVVRVHPQDFDALRTHKITLLEDFAGVEELEVEADETCTPGGCLIESGLAQADARIETMLANILEALVD